MKQPSKRLYFAFAVLLVLTSFLVYGLYLVYFNSTNFPLPHSGAPIHLFARRKTNIETWTNEILACLKKDNSDLDSILDSVSKSKKNRQGLWLLLWENRKLFMEFLTCRSKEPSVWLSLYAKEISSLASKREIWKLLLLSDDSGFEGVSELMPTQFKNQRPSKCAVKLSLKMFKRLKEIGYFGIKDFISTKVCPSDRQKGKQLFFLFAGQLSPAERSNIQRVCGFDQCEYIKKSSTSLEERDQFLGIVNHVMDDYEDLNTCLGDAKPETLNRNLHGLTQQIFRIKRSDEFLISFFDLVVKKIKRTIGEAVVRNFVTTQDSDVILNYIWGCDDLITLILSKYRHSKAGKKCDFLLKGGNLPAIAEVKHCHYKREANSQLSNEESKFLYDSQFVNDGLVGFTAGTKTRNSCFFNAIMQALVHTGPFEEFIQESIVKNQVIERTRKLLSFYWSSPYRQVSKRDMYQTLKIGSLSEMLNGEQQAADEFLTEYLDLLNSADPSLEAIFSFKFKTIHTSRCGVRGHKFTSKTEELKILSIPLSPDGRVTDKISFREAWNSFQRSQTADFTCYKCQPAKPEIGSISTLKIQTYPRVAILMFKRFQHQGEWPNFRIKKIETQVIFPSSSDGIVLLQEKKYQIYAFVRHLGTFQGGHYIAYWNHQPSGKWYCFDDAKVFLVDNVPLSDAFIVFAKKLE